MSVTYDRKSYLRDTAFADFYLKNITEDATIKKDSTNLKDVQNLAAGYELEFLKSFKKVSKRFLKGF